MDLRLAVKREYFEQIQSGEKTEEYRLLNDYWAQRLHGKTFDTVTITMGYPAAGQTDRILVFPFNGIVTKQILHNHFGDNPVTVFAIQLGGK